LTGDAAQGRIPTPVDSAAPVAGLVQRLVLTDSVSGVEVPSANIPESPAYPAGTCQPHPSLAACQNAGIAALNHARSVLGLGPYELPASFAALPAASQLLVLSNQDRQVYGLAPIRGLTAALNAAAQVGVATDTDPAGLLGAVDGVFYNAWTANWAAGWSSPIYTYYEWMYNDGPGSSNIDCTPSQPAGCWGHRASTLAAFAGATQIAMGVGTGTSPAYHAAAFTEVYASITSGEPAYLPAGT
jgi:hypothetical protein